MDTKTLSELFISRAQAVAARVTVVADEAAAERAVAEERVVAAERTVAEERAVAGGRAGSGSAERESGWQPHAAEEHTAHSAR